jgi:hypothetical protein
MVWPRHRQAVATASKRFTGPKVERSAARDDQMLSSRGEELLEPIDITGLIEKRRPLDRRWVSADPRAPRAQDLVLAGELLWGTEAVPHVRVPGGQPQRHLLPLAPDHDGQLADRRRIEAGQAGLEADEITFQSSKTTARRPEFVVVFGVVPLAPTRPDPQDDATAAQVVGGSSHVGHEIWIAVGVARHQNADAGAGGLTRHCG